ncbi:GNAT family N-acetyltransferase [Embleya hyalina]|uniref:GNAT family acetyltransferase n=1 Tax=Embleya hyalina TaxID=516124 RepID=A0A401YQJ8_9ACTN|nr:GNAT family N-acetyltransferase [Embleya hyalina]GCD96861.1 GNAT family acetyltransferase [Embleya hyalina]
MNMFLGTDRLVLRRFTETDVDHLFALHNDPDVMRFINGGRPTTRESIETETVPKFLRVYPGLGHPGFWIAEDRADGSFMGWFAFRPLVDNSPAVVELGYRLRKAAWGGGYATEGSRALIHKGFDELGVQRVTANTMTVNTGSRRVMEKAGLTFVRTFFEDWPEEIEGSEQGDVEYELTRADWERL